MYFQSKNKAECCACSACVSVCPKSCIQMVHDEEGFAYPVIDETICISCHQCEKVCPVEHPDYSNNNKPAAFAVILKDLEQRMKSSSGGVFYAIATFILRNKGIVVGATIDEEHQVRHIAVDSLDELFRLRGSKYVQSDLGGVFLLIRQALQEGRWCYFVGTGCQVAGLKSFLKKDYSKLITSDLVCHGVPSQKLFDTHISYLEKKYGSKVVDYQFRNNKLWGGCEIVNFANHQSIINPSYELSPYLYSFMYGMTFRYSCYDCKFSCIPRQGDITLADFWGVRKFFPKMDAKHGVSLVLLNSEKGRMIWEQIKSDLEYNQSTVSDSAKYNGNLINKSKKPEIRDGIYKKIEDCGYEKIAKSLFKSPRAYKVMIYNAINNNCIFKFLIYFYKLIKNKFYQNN